MELYPLIDPDTGTDTLAGPDMFGVGGNGLKYGPGGRTFVIARFLNMIMRELQNYVSAETGYVEGRWTQMRDVALGRAAAAAACNYTKIDTDGLSTIFVSCAGGFSDQRTVYVGLDGNVLVVRGNKHVSDTTAGTADFNDIAQGDGVLIAVNSAGEIWRSQNSGSTWDLRTNPSGKELKAIIYAGARFVAVGVDGAIVVSTDSGATFVDHSLLANLDFVDVIYDGVGPTVADTTDPDSSIESDKFYAIETTANGIYTSTIGESWSLLDTFQDVPMCLAYANFGIYVLLDNDTVAASYNQFASHVTSIVPTSGSVKYMAADPQAGCIVVYDDVQTVHISLSTRMTQGPGGGFHSRPLVGPLENFPSPAVPTRVRFVNGRFCLPASSDDLYASHAVWK